MPIINNIKATWNNIATTFTAIKMDVTDTNSASDSKLIDLQVGSVSKFSVDKNGEIATAGTLLLQYKVYDTVALLLASTEASRGTGAIWEAGGFRYIEVASGGDVTNSAGTPVQLDVLPNQDGSYSLLAFGAAGDGTTDDTTIIQTACSAIPSGVWLTGEGQTYLISTTVNVTVSDFKFRDSKFVFNVDYADQGRFAITSLKTHLLNLSVDGGRGTYKTSVEPWDTFSTFNGYGSIEPSLDAVFNVLKYDAEALVVVDNVNFYNVHAKECVKISTYGTVFIRNCEYKEISNKTFHVYHSPDNGVTQAGRTIASKLYAKNIGILPDNFLVDTVAQTHAGATDMPQGAFNFIVSHGDFTISDVDVWNYASCGVTADRNNVFKASNISILCDNSRAMSNNPSGAFWLEDVAHSNVVNLFIMITDRDARDIALESSALQLFCKDGSLTNITNLIIMGDNTTAKVNRHIRGTIEGDHSINISTFHIEGLVGDMVQAVNFAISASSVVGSDIRFSKGHMVHGSMNFYQPRYVAVDDVTLLGTTSGGAVAVLVSGAVGITGDVEHVEVVNSIINNIVSITPDVTKSIKICGNEIITGNVSVSGSSGIIDVSDNEEISANLNLSGISAISGIIKVLNNGEINGITTLTQGKSGRVSGNTTTRRIEIKDVETFEVVGNTAKTNAGEPIVWVNPVTAANILAGVISSNNILIRTGTVGAGYVAIGGGVVGVTDVNNNKLTVLWT